MESKVGASVGSLACRLAAVLVSILAAGGGFSLGQDDPCTDHAETVWIEESGMEFLEDGFIWNLVGHGTTDAPGEPKLTYKWTVISFNGAIEGPDDQATARVRFSGHCGMFGVELAVDTEGDDCGDPARDRYILFADCFPNWLPCDPNGDRKVDLTDPISVLLYLFLGMPAPICTPAGDCDSNGRLEITDAIFALRFLFLDGPSIPPPYPQCGFYPDCEMNCY